MRQGNYLKIPDLGDRGSVFCQDISDNFQVLDAHTHNGVDSPAINAKSISKTEISLLAANWIDTGSDFKQTINLPTGFDFDKTTIKAIFMSGANIGIEFLPSIKKLSPTSFELYCIYGDVNVKVVIS